MSTINPPYSADRWTVGSLRSTRKMRLAGKQCRCIAERWVPTPNRVWAVAHHLLRWWLPLRSQRWPHWATERQQKRHIYGLIEELKNGTIILRKTYRAQNIEHEQYVLERRYATAKTHGDVIKLCGFLCRNLGRSDGARDDVCRLADDSYLTVRSVWAPCVLLQSSKWAGIDNEY